jgi:Domain of unknown function (DUF5615)
VNGAPDAKPDALLLDEMFSPRIAEELALRGVDCRAVAADPVLRAQSDLEIFDAAVRDDRLLVTNNVPDFESLRRASEAAGLPVPALVYTCDATFPRARSYLPRLVAALESAAIGHHAARCGGVLWLSRSAAGHIGGGGPGVL